MSDVRFICDVIICDVIVINFPKLICVDGKEVGGGKPIFENILVLFAYSMRYNFTCMNRVQSFTL